MRLFDTHCHFETEDAGEIAAVLERAKSAGVEKLLAVGGSPSLNAGAAAAQREGRSAGADVARPCVLAAMGFDRDQIRLADRCVAESFGGEAQRLCAWGEIGLDYWYSPQTREEQMKLFAEQLEEASRRDLPVIIHTREAAADTAAILKEIPSRGVIHCFTGTPNEAKTYLDLGFYISISGIVTFRTADNVRESALAVPDDRILIETDAPFLAPVPMRGRANEPAFIAHTCEFLAKLRGVEPDVFAELTYANAERLFS